jgi:hypothetical protein
MLILEIVLAVSAWKRGWRWWVLLPLGITLGGALLAGFVIGMSGVPDTELPNLVGIDFLLIIALAVMSAVGPRGSSSEARQRVEASEGVEPLTAAECR